jgi:hypothetical protein
MRHLFTIILFLLVFISGVCCQEKADTLSVPGIVYLKLKNINFVKNNEYFNPVIEGYTLIGYFIQPEIVYSPSKKVRLQLGTHLLNYAGAARISQAKLVFSTTYNFTENTFLTLGTLSGVDKHRMLDPHFDNERIYKANLEDGLQFVTENDHIFSDTWINWENFIFKGDTTREIFTFGESFRYKSARIADVFRVEIPVQLQFSHFGGQISNYSGSVETYFNLAAGMRINFDIDRGRFGTAGIEYLQFINNELTKTGASGVTRGYASWLRFHYNYKPIYFGSYYWKGHNFFAPNGNPIYSSVSTVTENLIVPDRAIWTNSLYLTFHPLDYLEIFLGFDAYYDLNLKHMDTAMTLHLYLNKLIKLVTLNQSK